MSNLVCLSKLMVTLDGVRALCYHIQWRRGGIEQTPEHYGSITDNLWKHKRVALASTPHEFKVFGSVVTEEREKAPH